MRLFLDFVGVFCLLLGCIVGLLGFRGLGIVLDILGRFLFLGLAFFCCLLVIFLKSVAVII